jgi:hypothetical protein
MNDLFSVSSACASSNDCMTWNSTWLDSNLPYPRPGCCRLRLCAFLPSATMPRALFPYVMHLIVEKTAIAEAAIKAGREAMKVDMNKCCS